MKIRLAGQTNGGLQFIVSAETDAERVVLTAFGEQSRRETVHIHGWTYHGDNMIGPSSFNFGTIRPRILAPIAEGAD